MAQYEKAIQTAFREVADALAGRDTLGEQLRARCRRPARPKQTAIAWPICATATARPASLDVLDAQRSLFTTQTLALQSRLAQAQNQVTLYKVLGGGWIETATSAKAQ